MPGSCSTDEGVESRQVDWAGERDTGLPTHRCWGGRQPRARAESRSDHGNPEPSRTDRKQEGEGRTLALSYK